MEHHFTWFGLMGGVSAWVADHHNLFVVHLIFTSVLLILAALWIHAKVTKMSAHEAALPAGTFSLYGLFQSAMESFTGMTTDIMGKHHTHLAPLVATTFIIVFVNNVLGLVPGFTSATADINVTLALGVMVFVYYNYKGFKENGLAYIKHFFGPLLWLAPLMFLIEVVGHAVRPLSLGLRLRGNISGDHIVYGIFNDSIPSGLGSELAQVLMAAVVPIPFVALGLMVCVIQAFVFTLLSMIYLSLATEHDH